VTDVDDFIRLLHSELGLELTADDLDSGFDQVPGWDSVHLLTLLVALERETGQRISLPDVLEAPNLAHIYQVAVPS
jgi:acyl carrier protein